ncbi:leucine-rich repeat-containing protein 9 [Bradysia coprophila]|uniref:leucine-rich repeat-containing protein 9 n=1 Tax=Bradysia coprophila TaxID=38358 RepID=UPI00187D8851|nr:leucine-rich repeat-containing protein 9 [Bradysia coprophila]
MPVNDLPPEETKSTSSSSDSASIEQLPSSLSSISLHEDDFGTETVYQPLVIPREPKLDELLRKVSGSQDLHRLTEVNLKLSSTMVCIQRLEVFLPNLVSLNLDGSSLNSLRDLGTGLVIKYLNVSRCGLTSLDGTNGLASLIHLVAESNAIREVSPIFNLNDLRKLNLRGNLIDNFGTVSFLSMCPELIEVDLISNPVCYLNNYRNEVKSFVPNLVLLDGTPFNSLPNDGTCETGNTSSEFSSLSDQTRSDVSNNEIVTINHQLPRPNSFGNINMTDNKTIRINRPSTADPINPSTSRNLSSGEPVCGNVISRIRFNRKHKRPAWIASDTSSSVSSGSDSISSREFPEVLPQQSFDLELGVLGMVGSESDPNRLSENDDHAKLLRVAKTWRRNKNLSMLGREEK